MNHSTVYPKRAFGFVLFACLVLFGQSVNARTPAGESVCDGLKKAKRGICVAYCEAMDCDSPHHKASNRACQKKVRRWSRIAGDVPLPCNESAAILMTKAVNASADSDFEIPVGDPVIYSFNITNSGNVPVVIMALSDAQITGALDDCNMAVIGQTLAVNESITCDSDAGEISAIAETVENTATVSATSLYGTQLSAQGTAIYTGSSDGVPDETFFGTPLAITFSPLLLIDQVLVEVADAWLTDPAISLDIEITGINGTFEFHGEDIIDVVDTTVFQTDGIIADAIVDWSMDTTTQNVNEVYTVCVQPIRNTTELIGSVHCTTFGPF